MLGPHRTAVGRQGQALASSFLPQTQDSLSRTGQDSSKTHVVHLDQLGVAALGFPETLGWGLELYPQNTKATNCMTGQLKQNVTAGKYYKLDPIYGQKSKQI